ncbi:hypothetical protein BH24PSE2_BH24PSE2_04750 [soil metagenome]
MRTTCILLAASVCACATKLEIHTDYSRGARFSDLQTFAWQDSHVSSIGNDDSDVADRVDSIIRRSVSENLTVKGYRQIDSSEPDFLVSYHIVVTEQEDPLLHGEYVSLSDVLSSGDTLEVYREDMRINEGIIRKGTLILFFVEPHTRRVIWQGIAEGAAVSARGALRKAERAIEAMLMHFPPGAADTAAVASQAAMAHARPPG